MQSATEEAVTPLPDRQRLEMPLHGIVAQVIADVLEVPVDGIGLDTTMTALGASSLDLADVCAHLDDLLGRPVPFSQIVRTPTVRSLSDWLSATMEPAAHAVPVAHGVPAAPAGPALPGAVDGYGRATLSSMQSYMLTKHFLDPDGLSLHCVRSWRILGRPDRVALRAAVEYLHHRHPILNSAFLPADVPVAEPGVAPVPRLRELLVDTQEQARETLARELARPFRLERGYVWQPVFVAVRQEPITLFGFAVHHIAFDGGSAQTMANDLAEAYNAQVRATAAEPDPPAAAPSVPVPDLVAIAEARQARLPYVDLAAQREYWRSVVADIPALEYPAVTPGAGVGGSPMVELALPDDVVAGVARLAARHEVSPYVVYLSAYGQAMAEQLGQYDFGVGTPINQRADKILTGVVNCLINIVCLRLRTDPGLPPAQAIADTKAVVNGAFAAQDVPVYDLVGLVEQPPAADRMPLFQTMFALQDNPPAVLSLHGLRTEFFRPVYPGVFSEVLTEVWPTAEGGARLLMDHQAGRVPEWFCRDLADRYLARLWAYVEWAHTEWPHTE